METIRLLCVTGKQTERKEGCACVGVGLMKRQGQHQEEVGGRVDMAQDVAGRQSGNPVLGLNCRYQS